MTWLSSLDLSTVQTIAEHRTPLGVMLAFLGTNLGSTGTIIALSIVIALYLALKHRRALLPFLITIFGSFASFEFLKDLIARPRPPIALAVYQPPLYSFPSGHATMAVAFYGFAAYFLARRQKPFIRYGLYLSAIVLALYVGFSRVYLGVHYPSDVLGGYVLGAFWLWIGVRMIPKKRS